MEGADRLKGFVIEMAVLDLDSFPMSASELSRNNGVYIFER